MESALLAKSPLSQTWSDDAPHFSRLVENGVTLAVIDRSCGRWDGRLEQTVVKFRSKTTRQSVGGLTGYTSREAAKIAVEDVIDAIRNSDGSAASSDGAALGRDALSARPAPDRDDEHRLTAFDVIQQSWVR